MSPRGGSPGTGPGPEDEWTEIVSGLEDVRRAGDRHLTGPRDWSPEEAVFGEPPPGAQDAEDEDAHYSPDPGPVTQGLSGGALLAWAVLIAVPVLLLVLGLMPGTLPWWVTVAGLVAVVTAIGRLLTSLPEDRNDLDDGARI